MMKRMNLPRRDFLKGLASVPAILSLAAHDQSHGAEPSGTKQKHRADWSIGLPLAQPPRKAPTSVISTVRSMLSSWIASFKISNARGRTG